MLLPDIIEQQKKEFAEWRRYNGVAIFKEAEDSHFEKLESFLTTSLSLAYQEGDKNGEARGRKEAWKSLGVEGMERQDDVSGEATYGDTSMMANDVNYGYNQALSDLTAKAKELKLTE